MDKKLKRTIVMIVNVVGIIFFSMVLQVLNIPLPFLPSFVRLQFSAVLELLGAIAYGPFVATFIVLAKEFFYFWLSNCGFGEMLTNGVTDLAFVIISSVIYINIKGGAFKKVNRKGEEYVQIVTRRKRIFISGLVATLVAVALGIVMTNFVELPMLIKTGKTAEELVFEYSKSIAVGDLFSGVLLVNAPIMALEYLLATIITGSVYKKVSGFMHGKHVS